MPMIVAGVPHYTRFEVAEYMRVSTRTITRRIQIGVLGCVRDGRRVWVTDSHVADYLKRCEVQPRAQRRIARGMR